MYKEVRKGYATHAWIRRQLRAILDNRNFAGCCRREMISLSKKFTFNPYGTDPSDDCMTPLFVSTSV